MAIADNTGLKPGAVLTAGKIRIKDAVRTATAAATVDFQFTQPAGTIVDSCFIHTSEAIELSGGSASSDVTFTIGSDADHEGSQLFLTGSPVTLIDYSGAQTEAAGTIVNQAIAVGPARTVAQNDTVWYGQVKCGAAVTADKSGTIDLHIVFRQF